MTKRIFWSTLLAQIVLLSLTTLLTARASFEAAEVSQRIQLREVTEIIGTAYEQAGELFVSKSDPNGYRITLVDNEGEILNEEAKATWREENKRKILEEFLALTLGKAEIVERQFETSEGELLLTGRTFSDGSVLVVASFLRTMGESILNMKVRIISILVLSIVLSLLLANLITKMVMKPLNDVDLESTEVKGPQYKEIQPLLNKIHNQKTAIVHNSEELAEREAQFVAITEAIQEGLILIGRSGKIIFINQSAINILGIEGDPLHQAAEVLGNEQLQRIILDTKQNGAQSTTIELEPFTYQLETTPMVYDQKKNGVAVLLYDITRRVNEENRRRDFTANVSHELKTPLHVISGCSELLDSGLVKPEDQKAFISQIHEQAKNMTHLVTDIIELSRLEEGSESSKKEILDMAIIASNAADNLFAIAEERGIELILDLSEALVRSSYTIVYEMIFNLMDNALKYTERGGHVTVITKTEGKTVYVAVKDDGIGIDETHHDRIFERFYRIDKSRSREVGGTGLGLAIVKHAAITSGGKVTIESKPGVGSVFTATFPKCTTK